MEGLIMAAQLILSLTILVFVHELGHFMAARAFGIRVEKFFIFFDAGGKKLFSFKRGGTEYGIGWLPLGGYVKIAGMIDESMDKEQMKKPPEEWEFRSKPAWQRFIVMIAGIVMNVITGILVMSFYLGVFEQGYYPVSAINEDGVYAYELARQIGFEQGDKLIAVNGKEKERFQDFESLQVYFGSTVTVERDGDLVDIHVPGDFFKLLKSGRLGFLDIGSQLSVGGFPDSTTLATEAGLEVGDQILAINDQAVFSFGHFREQLLDHIDEEIAITVKRDDVTEVLYTELDTTGLLGFHVNVEPNYDIKPYTFGEVLGYAVKDAWGFMYYNAVGIFRIAKGDIPIRDSIQSPIGIATMFGGQWNWARFWRLTAIISMILAFMNLLPIPALDGGHMMFLTIEMITRKPPGDKVLEVAQVFGMIVIGIMMLFAFGNDILKLFGL